MNIESLISAGIERLKKYCDERSTIPLWSGGPTGEEYWRGIGRHDAQGNPVGSYIGGVVSAQDAIDFMKLIDDWREYTPPNAVRQEHARYFRGTIPEGYVGYHAAMPLIDALNAGLKVKQRKGQHGFEWVTEITDPGATIVHHVVVILDQNDMLMTWHPGEPLAAMPENHWEFNEINPFFAVKIVAPHND